MKFKNGLEEEVFHIAAELGVVTTVEHNRTLEIEAASTPEVATFSHPPKKEIDVINASFPSRPQLKILISCKDYFSRAEPVDVQEWSAVVSAMNKYSAGSEFLGLILCPSGFTKGSEGWATMHNLALLPPLQSGAQLARGTVLRMFRRLLIGLSRRLAFPYEDLFTPPAFYDFSFELTSAFEAREIAIQEEFGDRYTHLPFGNLCSFADMFAQIRGLAITGFVNTSVTTGLQLENIISLAYEEHK